jgi:ketol-acid reductoisomerase
VKLYRTGDVPTGALDGESIAMLGYGNLGRSAALNLRDSGVTVRVGNRDDEYAERARADGFEVVPLATAAGDDVVFVLLPDEVIPEVFDRDVAPSSEPERRRLRLGLLPGVRPRSAAPNRRRLAHRAPHGRDYGAHALPDGPGLLACVGVEADRSGRALRRMLGLADALGALRPPAIEMTAATEAALDLLVEQTIGPLLGTALMTAFAVGCEGGIP